MKNVNERMKEYVQYHITGDADCNTVLMRKWADNNKLCLQERYDLSYFFGITYCIPSAIFMLKEKEKGKILNDIDKWVEENKSKIIFQSDRKYVRMRDNFNNCIKFYKDNLKDVGRFLEGITTNNTILIEKALKKVQKWFFFGRFASYLFLETFTALTDYKIENTTIDWKNGDTATSGIMNLFGFDNGANYFDKHDKLPPALNSNTLDSFLFKTLREIRAKGGDDNITGVETSLCAYRKFYKGSRYNGFYLDRQLEEILTTIKNPEYESIDKELLCLREELFNHKYLGELNDWRGVRKEAKTLYRDKGIML